MLDSANLDSLAKVDETVVESVGNGCRDKRMRGRIRSLYEAEQARMARQMTNVSLWLDVLQSNE
jgi:hypothetical protein